MTRTPLHIPTSERGVLRLFALDMRPEELRFLREDGAIRDVLGTGDLTEAHVQLIHIPDLEDLGITGYLREGCDIPDDQIIAQRAAIDTIGRDVMAVPSIAFNTARTVTLDPRIRFVAQFQEPASADWSKGQDLKTDSAAPYSGRRLSPRQYRSRARWIGGLIFAGFMALTALIAWWIIT